MAWFTEAKSIGFVEGGCFLATDGPPAPGNNNTAFISEVESNELLLALTCRWIFPLVGGVVYDTLLPRLVWPFVFVATTR